MDKEKTTRPLGQRIIAIVGIVILLSLYVCALVLALIRTAFATTMLKICFIATFFIPVITHFIIMFYKLSRADKYYPTKIDKEK